MRLTLVAASLFAAVPALAASAGADSNVVARHDAPAAGHSMARERRQAHRQRRGTKKCKSKGGNQGQQSPVPSASSTGGDQAWNQPSASAAPSGGAPGDLGNQFWAGNDNDQSSSSGSASSSAAAPTGDAPSSAASSGAGPSSSAASSEGAAPSSSAASSEGGAPSSSAASSEGAAPSSSAAQSSSSASSEGAPSSTSSAAPEQSSADSNSGDSAASSGDFGWLNGAPFNPGEAGGIASFYNVGGNEVYCGGHYSDDDAIIALSKSYWEQIVGGSQWSNGPPCGKKVSITWNGVTKSATVADMCPDCPPEQIDLPQGFWASFTNNMGLGLLGLEQPSNPTLSWKWE